MMNSTKVTHLARRASDHCPIIFEAKNAEFITHSNFRILDIWMEHSEFEQTVRQSWNTETGFSGLMNLKFGAFFFWKKYVGAIHPDEVREKRHTSPYWKRLLEGREKAKDHIFWNLGKGKISFWIEKWLGNNTINNMCNGTGEYDTQCLDMWTNGQWDDGKLRTLDINDGLREQIKQIPTIQGKDRSSWMLYRDGKFNTKSAWELIKNKTQSTSLFKALNSKFLRPTIKIFGMKLYRKWIPTDENIQAKGIYLASSCQCHKNLETSLHLFLGMSKKPTDLDSIW